MPDWVSTPFKTYARRMPRDCALELIEVAAAKRSKNQSSGSWMKQEAELIKKHIDNSDWLVVLDVTGDSWSTPQLAQQLNQWRAKGSNVALVVGGPDGLDPQIIQSANQKWSLSQLTFPHPLVRVIVAETLYRAWSVTVNHPYHRE